MGTLPIGALSFNEGCWALDRTIVNCGFMENKDYISSRVGATQVYTFYEDGWAYCRIVLSPVIDRIEGGWGCRYSLISSSASENAERLKAWKSDVMKLPYSEWGFYSELPDFTDRCNGVWNLLYQEWGKVAAAKSTPALPMTGTQMKTIGDWIIERELIFNGNPAEFKKMLEWFTSRRFMIHHGAGERWSPYGYSPDSDSAFVEFRPSGESVKGWADAISSPGGKALIRVYAKSGDWPALRETWGLLENELRQQGWIIEANEAAGDRMPKEHRVDFCVDMPIADFRESQHIRLLTDGTKEDIAGFPEAWKANPTHHDYQFYAAYAPGDGNTTRVFVTFRDGHFFGPRNADNYLVDIWRIFPSARPDLQTVIADPEMARLLPNLAREAATVTLPHEVISSQALGSTHLLAARIETTSGDINPGIENIPPHLLPLVKIANEVNVALNDGFKRFKSGEGGPIPVGEEEPPKLFKPDTPQKPVSNSGLAIWFDYYHECKRGGIRYTLSELAKDTHRSHGAIRQEHLKYKAERDIPSR